MSWDQRAGRVDDRDDWADDRDPGPSDGPAAGYRDTYGDEYRRDYADDRDASGAARARRRRSREDEPSSGRLPRITLGVAVVASILFLVIAIAARDIPLLVSATTIFGIVFIALAVVGGRATWRAATDGQNGRAFGLAVGGGLAAMIGLGALAMAIDLVLIWGR